MERCAWEAAEVEKITLGALLRAVASGYNKADLVEQR
jgi:hypothetical protein